MSDNRKYYYLKLKENYFDDDSIVLLESMQDGVLYSNILLKLYLKSLKHGGRLQLDEDIPYTAQMIATLTRQQVGTVERALGIFQQLGLVEQLHGGLLFREVGFFRCVALAAVKQPVLARVVLRLRGISRRIQNSFRKQITHKLSPSLQVYSGMPCFGAAFAVSSAAHLRIVAAWFLYFLPVDAI